MPTTLTKKQIVIETIEYIHKNGRAKSGDHCMYKTVDGKQCAFGRCMDMCKYSKDYEGQDVNAFVDHTDSVDYFLQTKYHGHDLQFWAELQHLHDYNNHWYTDENGDLKLSEEGRIHADGLLYRSGEPFLTKEELTKLYL